VSLTPQLFLYNSHTRPISNLTLISKFAERIVKSRLTAHLSANSLFNPCQSAYTKHHSTETTLLSIHNHVIIVISLKQVKCLSTALTLTTPPLSSISLTARPTLQSSWHPLPWTYPPPFSTWPDGIVPSSQLTEHRGIASAACPYVALSGLHQSAVIHSFIPFIP
jgi:hypothetical protein